MRKFLDGFQGTRMGSLRADSLALQPEVQPDELPRNYNIEAKLQEKEKVKVNGDQGPDLNRISVDGMPQFDKVKNAPFQIYDDAPKTPVTETPPVSVVDTPPVPTTELTPTPDAPKEKGRFGWFHKAKKAVGPAAVASTTTFATISGLPHEQIPQAAPPPIQRGLDVSPPLVQTPDIAPQPTVPAAPAEPGVPLGPEQPPVPTVTDPTTGNEIPVGSVTPPVTGVGSPEDKDDLKKFTEVRQYAGNIGSNTGSESQPQSPAERSYVDQNNPQHMAAEQAVNQALGIGSTPAETPAVPVSDTPQTS